MKILAIAIIALSVIVIGACAFYGFSLGVGLGWVGIAVGAFALVDNAEREDESNEEN